MRKHDGDVRQYRILSESWYADANMRNAEYTEEILFGMYCPEGGTSGEFSIRWIPLGGESSPVLTAFGDAWSAMAQFPELLQQMVEWDSRKVSPAMVKEWLKTTTIEDATERSDRSVAKQAERKTYMSKPSSP